MRLARLALAAALLASAGWDLPTRPDGDVAEGNRAYQRGDFQRALAAYRRALDGEGDDARVHFDIGAALYGLAEGAQGAEAAALYDRAESSFRRAAESRDPDLAARAYYNLGNVHFRRERYDAAISAYRVVLRLDPSRDDARHNLELALRRREQQQPPSGQGGAGRPGQPPPDASAPGGGAPSQQPGASGESPQPETGDGRGEPGEAPRSPSEDQPPPPEPPAPSGQGAGQSGGAEPAPSAPPRPSSAGDIERKLRALERRSRELRHERLRSGSRDSDAPRLQHGEDW